MSKPRFLIAFVIIGALVCASLAAAAGPPAPTGSKGNEAGVNDVERGPLDVIASGPKAHELDSRKLIARTVDAKPEPKKAKKPTAKAVPSGPVGGVSQATLDSIAACESGGDPAAVNAGGYYGKYQFDLGTWASVGGKGNPADASEGEQDYRASLLYARAGSSPWPVCGQ